MRTISEAEWAATPADYKLSARESRAGVPMILRLDPDTGGTVLEPVTILDERDVAILTERVVALVSDPDPDPRVGDYVRFPDGRLERVSFAAPREWDEWAGVQTSTGGSWYLGRGYVSFSGSLNPWIPIDALTRTDETRDGAVWFFHHDYAVKDGGVPAQARFRVYDSTTDPADRR